MRGARGAQLGAGDGDGSRASRARGDEDDFALNEVVAEVDAEQTVLFYDARTQRRERPLERGFGVRLSVDEGVVKVISCPESRRVLGVGMVGPHASELIAEGTLAVQLGATLEDLMVTIHAHPTLSEALMEAAEVAAGMPVHIHPVRKAETPAEPRRPIAPRPKAERCEGCPLPD